MAHLQVSSIDVAELTRQLGQWTRTHDTLARSLSDALVQLMDAGLLPAGSRLPSQRELAATLGTARGTVVSAYDFLQREGYVTARQGSGFWVRSDSARGRSRMGARMFAFTSNSADWIDLSSGALPASSGVAAAIAALGRNDLDPYLPTDGYFPMGLPGLRRQIAAHYTRDGLPTQPNEILVTSGAQQAVWLAAAAFAGVGVTVLVEEPGYRGGLEAFAATGATVEGIRVVNGGIDVDLVRQLGPRAQVLYCQTSIHNPTGATMASNARRELAEVINHYGILTVEDTVARDLVLAATAPAPVLAGLVDPELLVTIGTASKLFWGGLRIGWVVGTEKHLRAILQCKRPIDLAASPLNQLITAHLLDSAAQARRERQLSLAKSLEATEAIVHEIFPDWTWERPHGGSGLWVDTKLDAVALTETAKRVGVLLAPGPSFSSYRGLRSKLRLPIWHEADVLSEGLGAIAGAFPH
ncbi:MAG: PLP-dependent aminotransferase family protein [Propionicimonas sp.]|nr:PLP-dependent aminotransferase family protein [Propionicimonas sp.]